jgi:hypothetical protein
VRRTRSLLIGTAVAAAALVAVNGIAYAHDDSDGSAAHRGSRHTQSHGWTDYRQHDYEYHPGDQLDEPEPTPGDRQANDLTGALGWKQNTEPH